MTPTTPAPGGAVSLCDHASVGVLISSPNGLLLVFDRATPPAGIAPVAGHVVEHGGPEQAARGEVTEEVGLAVTHLHLLLNQWRPNRCRRTSSGPVGHHWWVFQAEVAGSLRPSPREVRAPRWIHPDRLQQHALRTAAYANGCLSREVFEREPGLEPVWCRFLHDLELITLPSADLDRIEAVL
ncbi:NUDIX hydrolase [Streptomyces poriferorum]|uniref:NUDIX hydrolase n=1 Tax=Streptomyces poriferorum TaxID=2798799 RepID=A0ABY9IKS1_9ACTN|nr:MULTISPECIES: NUDIX hydrolase [unclassified Streptomyces]MDP5315320.1 NUDIX hydrolase [Streptomyces sp. Alt4]WLQ55821.1 NUDIX hydrolase [Streptomyces sp. Alt2]